ncbi:MAG TPA: SAM-dependent methyltransferase [Alphaproteobacteria bacterium]|nr:SAM-dependent methyltransferase [Alphaproteobacteria bacterium]
MQEITGYLAPEGFLGDLLAELGAAPLAVHDRLVLAEGPARPLAWAENVWHAPQTLKIASIKEGAKALRAMQRNWALYDFQLHRRARLIQDQLPHVSAKPLPFPQPAPTAPLGSWTLIDAETILAAPHCSSPFPNGAVQFVEDKAGPPNRAYLKLWEAFTQLRRYPGPGSRCLDLGSSPGGWTWVMQQLGADVVSIDKAPLDPAIARLPRIEYRRDSAFAVKPADIGALDWLCCDVICYPTRLLPMIRAWLESGLVRNIVCTLKFQAETDHATAAAFAAIPGGRLVHLHHNKHELTWLWPGPDRAAPEAA